jgi:hypothetical protein
LGEKSLVRHYQLLANMGIGITCVGPNFTRRFVKGSQWAAMDVDGWEFPVWPDCSLQNVLTPVGGRVVWRNEILPCHHFLTHNSIMANSSPVLSLKSLHSELNMV